ncbi:MAG TPA: hypothetical protein VF549_02540 [Solirubrobacteraceae bacterium]
MIVRAVVLVFLLALLVPASAEARLDIRYYHGSTQLGGEVALQARPSDRYVELTVGWRIRCRGTSFRAEDVTILKPPRYATSGREFAVVGALGAEDADEAEVPQDRTATVVLSMTGRRVTPRGRPGGETWAGVLDIEVELRRDDEDTRKVVARCHSRQLRWRAWREGYGTGSLEVAGEPGEYVTDGRTWTYGPRGSEFSATGDRQSVGFVALGPDSSWSAEFSVPEGQALRRGAHFVADGDEDGGPRMEVERGSRYCSGDQVGDFTVRSIRLSRGRIRDVSIAFTARCNGARAALHGTLTFRSAA